MVDDLALIQAANYDEHLDQLKGCDLIIEAIAERMDWKVDLYKKIASHVAPHAIVASNTSGLSITKLSEGLPIEIKPRFCGIHFFNPPRYMSLVELIPTPTTQPEILDQLETFVTTSLGKSVVRAKDTPNFIANRVGIAGMLATMVEAEKFGLAVDVVDDLTGKKMGRASSGTFRTADVVGLDTMAHVVKTMQDNLQADPFYPHFATPKVLAGLIEKGALGQKTGAGFYKKVGKDILRLDPAKGDYVPSSGKADPIVERMLKKPAGERLKLLRESSNPQAQFIWSILRDGFHYAAVHLEAIADNARDVDFAMRWGFGLKQGPFELWQEAGWKQVAQWIADDIASGKALANAPLPAWVTDGRDGVHTPDGSWSPSQKRYVPRSKLPVYQRQPFPEAVIGSGAAEPSKSGTELYKNDEIRVWTLDGEVAIASIIAKLHLISPTVIEGLSQGARDRRRQVQGPGDLVARRRVLGRCQPRIADAGVHEDGLQGHQSRSEEAAGLHASAALCAGAGGVARCEASRWAAAANLRCTARAALRTWRPTSAWSRSASAWCRPAAAWRRSRAAQPSKPQRRRAPTCWPSSRSRSPPPRWPRSAPVRSRAGSSATC